MQAATGMRTESLYYLDCMTSCQHVSTAESFTQETKEKVWHQCFGHLGVQNLQKISKNELVNGFDYDVSEGIGFCESCAERKYTRCQFPPLVSH